MQSLNTLVQQRKVLYLGISDTPAWVVVKANWWVVSKVPLILFVAYENENATPSTRVAQLLIRQRIQLCSSTRPTPLFHLSGK